MSKSMVQFRASRPGKRTRKPLLWTGLAFGLFLAAGCSGENDGEYSTSENSKTVPASETFRMAEGSGSAADLQAEAPQAPALPEGSGTKRSDHPQVQNGGKIERGIVVPEGLRGKWKAVKILIKNKAHEEQNETRTVELGSSFQLGHSGLKVTVGPFFPNFVMSQKTYTSMNNQLINPAVRLVVEENGKIIYKGWAFKNYPTLYAFEHPDYAFELKDYVPREVS
ncbi:MAG: hypothetical protein ACE5E9_12665 [Nitrospinaceae bacterium]